jgi:hypothetical protein
MVTTLTVVTFTEGSVFAEGAGFRSGGDGKASTDLGASARAICSKGLLLTTDGLGLGEIGGDVQSRFGPG